MRSVRLATPPRKKLNVMESPSENNLASSSEGLGPKALGCPRPDALTSLHLRINYTLCNMECSNSLSDGQSRSTAPGF